MPVDYRCRPDTIDDSRIPDLRPVENAAHAVGKHLAAGSTVVFESTVYPGVTEDICVPILEKQSGLNSERASPWAIPGRINPAIGSYVG